MPDTTTFIGAHLLRPCRNLQKVLGELEEQDRHAIPPNARTVTSNHNCAKRETSGDALSGR